MTGRVVLVYPYFREKDPVQKLFPPLGLAYIAGQLKERAIDVSVVDCTFTSPDSAVEEIVALNPAIVGISVMVTLSQNAIDLAEQIRLALPETLLVAGGPLPSVYPNRYLPPFDLVFRGESDLVFPDFCQNYLASGERGLFLEALDVSNYPGLCITNRGQTLTTEPLHRDSATLDSLPPPDRSHFSHRRYQQHWHSHNQASQASIMLTRGCPLTCDFCSKPVWGSLYRKLDLDKAFDEIKSIIDRGYESLWIADDSFTLDLSYLREFCRQKLARGIDIEWTCLSRARGLDRDTVDLMKEAGCVKVYLGLESGSNVTLQLMGKNNTVQEGIDTVRLFNQAGIKTAGFFLVGYPGETIASIESTLSLALSLPLDEISINVPFPLPGSGLYSKVYNLNPDDDWEQASAARFLYESEFNQAWLKRRIRETMEHFRQRRMSHAEHESTNWC